MDSVLSRLASAPILGLLALLGWAYYLMPQFARRAWGASFGILLRLLGLRAPVVWQNLQLAYPDSMPGAEASRKSLYRASYSHLARIILEVTMLFGPMQRYATRRAILRGNENWKAAKARGKGVIFLASHVGNWEVMAATGALQGGIDIILVTKHLKPEWLHRAIERRRLRCNVRATYEPRTLRDVLRHLKDNGTVGFVLDQYAGPPVGVRVPVFGVPVGTTTAIAMIAKRTGAAVLPVVNYRTPDSRWVVQIRPALEWTAHEDAHVELAINTARFAEEIERDIRAHPEQWLWIHRRFKGDLSPLRPDEWAHGRIRT